MAAGEILTGILIHRKIDQFTDAYPAMRELKAILRQRHRKYSPVVLDILLDHVLVDDWSFHSEIPFDVFQNWVYAFLVEHESSIPERLKARLRRMREHQWLNDYTHLGGLQKVLDMMDYRANFPSRFGEAVLDLEANHAAMQLALRILMRDLRSEIREMQLSGYPSK